VAPNSNVFVTKRRWGGVANGELRTGGWEDRESKGPGQHVESEVSRSYVVKTREIIRRAGVEGTWQKVRRKGKVW